MMRSGLFTLCILLFFASCATGPKGSASFEDAAGGFSLLPPGAAVYCYVDVPAARPILDHFNIEGIRGRDMKEVLDRTVSAAAAFYPPESPRRFFAAARGTYPSFRANTIFSLDSGWKKQRSEGGTSYWYSAGRELSVALDSRRALVSDKDPLTVSPGAEIPENFIDFSESSILAGWFEGAAAPLSRFLESLEIPLQIPAERLFFAVYPVDATPGNYEALIRLKTPSASQARALTTLFAMARLFIDGAASSAPGDPLRIISPFFVNLPLQEDTDLTLRTGRMSGEQIALLFNLFSVYSR